MSDDIIDNTTYAGDGSGTWKGAVEPARWRRTRPAPTGGYPDWIDPATGDHCCANVGPVDTKEADQ